MARMASKVAISKQNKTHHSVPQNSNMHSNIWFHYKVSDSTFPLKLALPIPNDSIYYLKETKDSFKYFVFVCVCVCVCYNLSIRIDGVLDLKDYINFYLNSGWNLLYNTPLIVIPVSILYCSYDMKENAK